MSSPPSCCQCPCHDAVCVECGCLHRPCGLWCRIERALKRWPRRLRRDWNDWRNGW